MNNSRDRQTDAWRKYVVCALWLVGYTESAIRDALSLQSKKQVAGIVQKAGFGNRSALTDEDREEKLKELRHKWRGVGGPYNSGVLERRDFRLQPVGTKMVPGDLRRRLKQEPNGRDGRPAIVRLVKRDNVYPAIINTAPLEYLHETGKLEGEGDTVGAGHIRWSAAQRYRSIMEGAEISGLRAANLEGSSGGGAPGRLPGDYKMDCIKWLAMIRAQGRSDSMAPDLLELLERVIYRDEWLWEKVRGDRQDAWMLRLHRALDLLAVRLMMISQREFNVRWSRARKPEAETRSPDRSPDPGQREPSDRSQS